MVVTVFVAATRNCLVICDRGATELSVVRVKNMKQDVGDVETRINISRQIYHQLLS